MDNNEEDLIRRRAYAIWEQEGRPVGQHLRHWEQASRDIQGPGTLAPDGDDNLAGASATQSVPPPLPRRKSAKNGVRRQ